MEPRLNIITLGVRDLDNAVKFYRDGLGWPLSSASAGDFAIFKLSTGTALALYPRNLLAKDAIAKQQLDTQAALVRQLEGTVKVDQGALDSAKLQLSYTKVVAPISAPKITRVSTRPGSITPVPTVFATLRPKTRKAMKLKKAAQRTA